MKINLLKSFPNQNKKKNKIFVFGIVVFQVFLLINLTAAISYSVSQTNSEEINQAPNSEKIKKITNLLWEITKKFFKIKQIGIVSAADPVMKCCLKTTSGGICQDMLATNVGNCTEALLPTDCQHSSSCLKGCCINQETGSCGMNSKKIECESYDNSLWKPNDACIVPECKKGCCVSGNQYEFKTQKECEYISIGKVMDFRNVNSELACIALGASDKEGACIIEYADGNTCRRMTEKSCLTRGGTPRPGYLCTNEELESLYEYDYEPQASIGCDSSGRNPGIYWFDNQGNLENIYSSNKVSSWNEGIMQSKEDSCGATSSAGNAGSISCGNCDGTSSMCVPSSEAEGRSVRDGNFICKDLTCEYDTNNDGRIGRDEKYVDGESWCVYEGKIGGGLDTAGSEHWKFYCDEGVVKSDRCGDQRSQICQEHTISEGSVTFKTATCVVNEANSCGGDNPLQKVEGEGENAKLVDIAQNISKCEENQHCMVQETKVDSHFNFKLCVPKYPLGGELSCSAASVDCTSVWLKKNRLDDWDCVANCECEKPIFAEKMNNLCVSMGDCGSYVNYLGDGTDNINVQGGRKSSWEIIYRKMAENVCEMYCHGDNLIIPPPTNPESNAVGPSAQKAFVCRTQGKCQNGKFVLNSLQSRIPSLWKNFEKNGKVVSGEHVAPQSLKHVVDTLASAGILLPGVNYNLPTLPEGTNQKVLDYLSTIIGVGGSLVSAATLLPGVGFKVFAESTAAELAAGAPLGETVASTLGAISLVAAGAIGGALIGGYLAKWLKVGDPAVAYTMMGTGAAAGVTAALKILSVLGSWGPTIALLALTVVIGFLLGGAEVKEYKNSFECLPWQAPLGGENCEKCDDNPLMECTLYRCESLGQMCHLIGLDTDKPVCEAYASETIPPVITPGEIKNSGYIFDNQETKKVQIIRAGGGCIQENSELQFTLLTDENAQCKWSLTPPERDYAEMLPNYPSDVNHFQKNHLFTLDLPSLDSLDVYNLTEEFTQTLGEINLYIKCQDGNAPPNYNIDPYVVNLCLNSEPDETVVDHSRTVFDPPSGTQLKFGTTTKEVTMYVSEPADCKYNKGTDASYDAMGGTMYCENDDLSDKTVLGYPCTATLGELTAGENKFYFKCRDKPWETDPEKRNTNTQSQEYSLIVSQSELQISSAKILYQSPRGLITIESGGKITEGTSPIQVELALETTGGAQRGVSICSWVPGLWSELESTDHTVHTQTITGVENGEFIVPTIRCQDIAGNEDRIDLNFTLEIDESEPTVVRVYKSGGGIKILTNEIAECYYKTNPLEGCTSFNFTNATKITAGLSKEHSIGEWDTDKVYYVKCKDVYERPNLDCAIIVQPSSLV